MCKYFFVNAFDVVQRSFSKLESHPKPWNPAFLTRWGIATSCSTYQPWATPCKQQEERQDDCCSSCEEMRRTPPMPDCHHWPFRGGGGARFAGFGYTWTPWIDRTRSATQRLHVKSVDRPHTIRNLTCYATVVLYEEKAINSIFSCIRSPTVQYLTKQKTRETWSPRGITQKASPLTLCQFL